MACNVVCYWHSTYHYEGFLINKVHQYWTGIPNDFSPVSSHMSQTRTGAVGGTVSLQPLYFVSLQLALFKILSRSIIHSTLFDCTEFCESGDSGDFSESGESGSKDFQGRVALQKRMNFWKNSKNLYCTFWTFKQAFSA